MLLGNIRDCISFFRQVPTRDGEALGDMLSVSEKGQRRRERGERWEGREVEGGVGWRWREGKNRGT